MVVVDDDVLDVDAVLGADRGESVLVDVGYYSGHADGVEAVLVELVIADVLSCDDDDNALTDSCAPAAGIAPQLLRAEQQGGVRGDYGLEYWYY